MGVKEKSILIKKMMAFYFLMSSIFVTSIKEVAAQHCSFNVGDTLQNCIKKRPSGRCNIFTESNRKFRSFDGTCNNVFLDFGSSFVAISKMILPPNFKGGDEDHPPGIPCQQFTSPTLPTPHEVSRKLFHITNENVENLRRLSVLFMAFGQFIDHDVVFIPHPTCKVSTCANEATAFKYPCYPIKFDHNKPECTSFPRSIPACKEGNEKREQINIVTAFIDGSQIYGTDVETSNKIRTLRGDGKLKLTSNGLLPELNDKDCVGCSLLGDTRGDSNMILNSLHIIWARDHNRIAENIRRVNPHWTGDMIFNTTRKIIGGLLQHIIYKEWLPNVVKITPKHEKFGLPLIRNAFATAAFRFGHSLIPNAFSQVDSGFNKVREDVLMQEAFSNSKYNRIHGIEATMLGLIANQSNEVNRVFSFGVGRKLMIPFGQNGYDDLAARNIQRGRDHGEQKYTMWRRVCHLEDIASFSDLNRHMQKEAVDVFKSLYNSVHDIDLFAAGISENHLPGHAVGPTFACIIKNQFEQLRNGDRFYYEKEGVFTTEQLLEIKKYSMAKQYCNNLDKVVSIQKNVFKVFKQGNHRISCDEIPDIDFKWWRETPVCDTGDFKETCLTPKSLFVCSSSRIRTFDGSCNNMKRSFTEGAAHIALQRMIRPVYADESETPRGFPCKPKHLSRFVKFVEHHIPTAHEVSKSVFSITSNDNNRNQVSVLYPVFGEFVANDIAFIPHEFCNRMSCENNAEKDFKYPCYPIKFSKERSIPCTKFSRSVPACFTRFSTTKTREQMNQVSSYIDASQIYGSNKEQAKRLRTNDGTGKLKLSQSGLLLPDDTVADFCFVLGGCSLTGDFRNDENFPLHSLYTTFVREHNRVAEELDKVVGEMHGREELLYQMARKIVGAEIQHIVYNEFLPKLFHVPTYDGYHWNISPGIFNGFATAAFRFGHSLVPNQFSQLDKNFDKLFNSVPLQEAFLNTTQIKEHGIEPTMFGLIGNLSGEADIEFPHGLARKLFIRPQNHAGHDDLMARNIQRGRDHGLPTYGEWRKKCGLPKLNSFDDLKKYMADSTTVDAFRNLYNHPDEIDLYAAGISEKHESGLLVGPTFSCIIRVQFEALRSGDKFFYEGSWIGFTKSQLAEIKKTSLAKVMCNNLKDIVSIQPDVFKAYREGDKRVECSSLPDINFQLWK